MSSEGRRRSSRFTRKTRINASEMELTGVFDDENSESEETSPRISMREPQEAAIGLVDQAMDVTGVYESPQDNRARNEPPSEGRRRPTRLSVRGSMTRSRGGGQDAQDSQADDHRESGSTMELTGVHDSPERSRRPSRRSKESPRKSRRSVRLQKREENTDVMSDEMDVDEKKDLDGISEAKETSIPKVKDLKPRPIDQKVENNDEYEGGKPYEMNTRIMNETMEMTDVYDASMRASTGPVVQEGTKLLGDTMEFTDIHADGSRISRFGTLETPTMDDTQLTATSIYNESMRSSIGSATFNAEMSALDRELPDFQSPNLQCNELIGEGDFEEVGTRPSNARMADMQVVSDSPLMPLFNKKNATETPTSIQNLFNEESSRMDEERRSREATEVIEGRLPIDELGNSVNGLNSLIEFNTWKKERIGTLSRGYKNQLEELESSSYTLNDEMTNLQEGFGNMNTRKQKLLDLIEKVSVDAMRPEDRLSMNLQFLTEDLDERVNAVALFKEKNAKLRENEKEIRNGLVSMNEKMEETQNQVRESSEEIKELKLKCMVKHSDNVKRLLGQMNTFLPWRVDSISSSFIKIVHQSGLSVSLVFANGVSNTSFRCKSCKVIVQLGENDEKLKREIFEILSLCNETDERIETMLSSIAFHLEKRRAAQQ